MRVGYPGSTEVVPWEETLPDYVEVKSRPFGPTQLRFNLADNEEESIERLHECEEFTVAAELTVDAVAMFDDYDVEDLIETLHGEGMDHLTIPLPDIQEKMD